MTAYDPLSLKYPPPPPPMLPIPYGTSKMLPALCGIYFAWHKGVVVYVGQSINIQQRVNSGHSTLKRVPGGSASWIEIDRSELNYAECYYIALCRPALNFGGNIHPNSPGQKQRRGAAMTEKQESEAQK